MGTNNPTQVIEQEFRANAFAMTGVRDESEAFAKRTMEAFARENDQILFGQKSGARSGDMRRAFAAARDAIGGAEERERRQAEQRANDLYLITIIQEQITWHREQMDGLENVLRDKYGVDFILGMAETFLDEGVLQTLDTRDAKLQALADLMLDENGNIKPQYINRPEAQYVYHWQKEQELENSLSSIRNDQSLTANQAKAINDSGAAALHNQHVEANEQAQTLAENNMDAASDKTAETKLDFM